VERAIKISQLTSGAFDISYASMDKIWKFDSSMTAMPSEEAIKNSVAKVGYQNIILNEKESTLFERKIIIAQYQPNSSRTRKFHISHYCFRTNFR
jgi:thiamine biosynthesis lipoprotein ApbE